MPGQPVDCVLIGYNEVAFGDLVAKSKPGQANNGTYSYLKANSILLDGSRVTYTELLNRVLEQAGQGKRRLNVFDLPNLGACYLASFLRRRGFAVEIVNFFNHDRDQLRQLLAAGPRAVAITTTFYVEPTPIAEIVSFVRAANSSTTIIVGGPHVFNICRDYDVATQDYILERIGADVYIYDSQGESTLALVVERLRAGRDLADVPNLIYRGGGEPPAPQPRSRLTLLNDASQSAFARTPARPENNDMNADAIDWSQLDRSLFTPATQTRTARSCAYKCSFCTFPSMAGELTLSDIDVVERELRYLQQAGVKYLTFIDDTFNVPLPRFKQLCKMMIRNRFEFQWISHFRPANADDECFELMRQSGCMAVFLGIESGDQSVLNNMNKAAKVERYAYGIERLHHHGIVSFASLIVGFPGETQQSVQNTIAFIENSAPTFYQAALYYHYPATPIHQKRVEHGIQSSGYSWRHKTMTWQEAAEAVDVMYRTIKNSHILPLFGFDFFGMPYFFAQGISFEQFRSFLRIAQTMLVDSCPDQPVDFGARERQLVDLFAPVRSDSAGPTLAIGDRWTPAAT
jgi:radical SAM PhpK family P-methyltransferase